MSRADPADLASLLAEKAAGDEVVLRKLSDDPDVPDEILGFHAQQAVEKQLKSVLAARGVAFERTHNLAYLSRLLDDAGVTPPPHADDLASLTPWATGFRYEAAGDRDLDRSRAVEVVAEIGRWAAARRAEPH